MKSKVMKTKVIGGLVLFVLVVGGWFAVVNPRLSHISQIQSQISDEQAKDQSIQTQIAGLERKKAALPQERLIAAALQKRFPPTAAQPELFASIQQAAVRAGIPANAVSSVTPSAPTAVVGTGTGVTPPQAAPGVPASGAGAHPGSVTLSTASGGNVATMTVAVSVTGSIDQIHAFLSNLENMPRAYLIDSVSVTSAGKACTVNITGTMFVMAAPVDPSVKPAK